MSGNCWKWYLSVITWIKSKICVVHSSDVIMSPMTSQITGVSSVCSGTDKKHQNSASLAFAKGIHHDRWIPLPSQRTSNAENVSIWWHHNMNRWLKSNSYVIDIKAFIDTRILYSFFMLAGRMPVASIINNVRISYIEYHILHKNYPLPYLKLF